MTHLLACDLDQTLIYSSRALRFSMPDAAAPVLRSVEVLDGRPISFMTLAAAELLTALSAADVFVPCTTRTVEQFQRVRLPLAPSRPGSSPGYAVTSNGGNLLVDGVPDLDWRTSLASRISESGCSLAEVVQELTVRAGGDWVLKRRTADDLFCYLVVDLALVPAGFLADWGGWCEERGWLLSVQGRKVYSTPLALRKAAAIEEVARRVGTTRVLAAGDGRLDAEMLQFADAGIRPAHGELAELGWSHPGVTVTEQVGVLAGEEILRWFGRGAANSSPGSIRH